MSDKLFYTLIGFLVLAIISLSLVWPQGYGAVSPKPFGHAVLEQDIVRMQRETAARDAKKAAEKRDAEKLATANAEAATSTSPSAAP